MKIKALNPSMREKKRYLKIKGNIPGFIDKFRELFGVYGMALAGIMEVSPGIIRINAKYVNHAKAAAFLSKCKIMLISGNLSKLKGKLKI